MNSINNYRFNIDTMTSFEGDTGPYLQDALARLYLMIQKARSLDLEALDMDSTDFTLLTEPHATNIVRLIAQFPDTIQNALKTLEPCIVLTYLFRLTHAVNSSYDVLPVYESESELMKARFMLYGAAMVVVINGMKILGMPFALVFHFF
jgi:arginyl-tRNA synthetase